MGPIGPEMLSEVEVEFNNNTKQGELLEADRSKTICKSTVMKMDIKRQMFVVGDIFMRKFYTIFDREKNRVGLARANSGPL